MKPLSDLNRLYKAISAVFDIEYLGSTKYDPSEKNKLKIIHLFEPISFRDTPYYLTCDDFGVIFYKANRENECFDIVHRIVWDEVKNFDIVLVQISAVIANNIYRTQRGDTI